jgi:N-acetylmuramoyl-L-alanine amidase
MPAVQVEVCFITSAAEEALLAHPSSRRGIAAAIAEGIERTFVPASTGGTPS